MNSSLASYEAKSSLISVSDKACRVSGYKATSAQLGAQPRFSAKLRVKHPSVLKAKLRSQLKKLLAARLELKHLVVLIVKLLHFITEHCSTVLKHQVLT